MVVPPGGQLSDCHHRTHSDLGVGLTIVHLVETVVVPPGVIQTKPTFVLFAIPTPHVFKVRLRVRTFVTIELLTDNTCPLSHSNVGCRMGGDCPGQGGPLSLFVSDYHRTFTPLPWEVVDGSPTGTNVSDQI